MSSQKSIPPDPDAAEASTGPFLGLSTGAVAPKRLRGHQRVAAILAAASDLFLEKGFDGTTMTEIAQRSGTAIGSLYRFFPTKESLADALLGQYVAHLRERLDRIAAGAAGLDPAALADALLDIGRDMLGEGAAAVILVDARRDGPYQRGSLRRLMRERIGDLVRLVAPALPPDRVAPVALMLLQFVKAVPLQAEEERLSGTPGLEELRRAARLYACSAMG
jgi:AcrR family transcriptional regulator